MATWTNYYTGNEGDGGHLEYLFEKSWQDLVDLCIGHLDDTASSALTILTSGGANLILLPSTRGEVIVLHQGLTTSRPTDLGGDLLLVFMNGNFSESPFKILHSVVVADTQNPELDALYRQQWVPPPTIIHVQRHLQSSIPGTATGIRKHGAGGKAQLLCSS
jgi:hypothetical protein